ncbi:TPA: hypothetical protein DIS56_02500 [Candidatus Saccharibacteria bacterium]|uniref:EamA domain-containing protein n=1 Tax=Candidatus Gottesmanbacteria bacterium RIFCSPHIGHO2_02_FULL_40_13 TaxID=1798384 RepID=A0A1F6A5P9_9BACT|nr:MAG: hypothetical protein A3D03_04335 [Candidatus Gottesmanbacteria bacterium RIFCSPHIGHO2_02_FULL_40_13]OGL34646.1 MAG: hypothetical protein A3F05_03720 [Candidatus Saccharibacteria bacterium RIFCSPHIGHO2_12_FULL_47_17]HCM51980.1 hypothetical protein [Candidatus Saccharibacteria bacterium]
MSDTLIATFGGLLAMVMWGTSDWLAARNSRKNYSAFEINLAIQLPGLFIMLAIMFLTGQPMPSLAHGLIITLAGLIFTGAYVSFIKALSIGEVGVVVPLASIFPLITIGLSVLFLTINFTGWQYLAMMIIVAGVILLAIEKRHRNIPLRVQHRAAVFALLAALLWGTGNFVQNIVIGKEPWQVILGFVNISMGLAAILIILFTNRLKFKAKLKRAVNNKQGLITGVSVTSGSFGFYSGSNRVGSVIIPSVVASASPLVASFLSAVIDKERLTIIKRAGAVIAVAGIIMLNIL